MGFFDLNVPYTDPAASSAAKSARIKIVIKAMELGYTGIAYNRTIKGVMSDRDRCSIPFLTLSSLLKIAPSLSSSVDLHRDLLGVPRSSPFRQYTRLTVCVDNAPQSQALNSGNPILKTYDIVAVRPSNQIAFDHACEKAEVDIISVDFSDKVPFRLKLPMVKGAIKRGVYFEIMYSGLIVDVQLRRQMISNAKLLVDWTRGKNLIFSSAAPSVCEVRGPNDVANLASLLGLSRERAKAAISKNCRSLLTTALRRKHFFKEAIRVEAMPSRGPFDGEKPLSADWINWDPISSGEGDLLLDDMAKSFSSSRNVSKTVKAIDFDSAISSTPFQVKSLISGTKAAPQSPAKMKNILCTTEPIESEKSSKLDLLPERNETLFDNTPSEHITSSFCDSQKLYHASDATKTSADSEELQTKTTSMEEDLQIHSGSVVVFASVETERQGLQSESDFPISEQTENVRIEASDNELNAVMPKENVASKTSAMDIEPDAALEISPPSEDNSVPPSPKKDYKNLGGSPVDLGAEITKVDDIGVDMDIDIEHRKNTSLSLNSTSLLENLSETIAIRGPEDDAVIAYQISCQQSDHEMPVKGDSLVATPENQVELVTEDRELGEADGKMNDESLHETFHKIEPTRADREHGEEHSNPFRERTENTGLNPFPESNEGMNAKDISSTSTNEIQEVAMEGQEHGEEHSKTNKLTIGKAGTSRRNPQQVLLLPLRRNLYPVSFKRKGRKSKHRTNIA